MSNSPTSFRLPFVLSDDVHPEVQTAIRYAFSGLKDLNDAINALVQKGVTSTNVVTSSANVGAGSSLLDSTVGSGAVVLDSGPVIFALTMFSTVSIQNLQIFANNAAAVSGGLVAGNLYRDGGNPDHVCVTH